MRTRTRLAVVATVAVLPLFGAAPVSAHFINTTTPSGQENSQRLGHEEHDHAGHTGGPHEDKGHERACDDAEQSGTVDFQGGEC